ncbi:MAG: trigger factor [Candidatus Kurthia intestinigallinarum]|uniref:trigger factor n=1 Tax=Kurthia sp. Dielmo TaxID=1033738 RepID=UPI00112369CB|nr:trigger factor [Kurthia sp. Dielmo]
MSAKWEKQEGNNGLLTVEVPAEEVNAALDAAFKKVVKQINVPGFRKGKMPRQLFEKKFGVESLYQDALDILLQANYTKAIDETGISPVDQPEIDFAPDALGKNQPFTFTAKVVVIPEVKLGDYKGLEVSKESVEVTDEEVEAILVENQKRLAELVVKEDGAVENGDTAVIDFEGFQDGEAFDGGKGEDYALEIGSNSFIPGFEEQLIGAKTGEEKEVEVTFPEEYHAAELAGKPAVFKVTVKEIKAKELPELNDDLASEIDSEVDTLDALRAKLKETTAKQKEEAVEGKLRDDLVEAAAANATIDVPEAMIETELNRMLQEFNQQLQMQGLNLDFYYQISGTDEASFRAERKEEAAQRVSVSLVLDAIAEAEGIEATEADIEAELAKMAEQFKMTADQITAALGGTSIITHDVKVQKTVEFLVENAKIA